MKKSNILKLLPYAMLLASTMTSAKVPIIKPGLIISGTDTIRTDAFREFDFILKRKCSTMVIGDDNKCVNHISFNPFMDPTLHYDIRVQWGYGIRMGKMNLDSIKSAPPDSVFEKESLGLGECEEPVKKSV